MDYFLIVISDKTICKDQTNFDLALHRYCEYVENYDSLCFISFGWKNDEEKTKSDLLIELYKYVIDKTISNFTVMRICFNEDILDEDLYKKNEIEPKYIMDFLEGKSIKNLYKEEYNDKNRKIWQLEDLIENIYFRDIVKSFMHGQTNDLVNSHLGLLKIWCDNSEILDDKFLKENKLISKSNEILNKLNKKFSIKDNPEFLQKEIMKIKYLINSILKITKKNNYNDKKDILSTKISQLFQFVSDYHEQIKG